MPGNSMISSKGYKSFIDSQQQQLRYGNSKVIPHQIQIVAATSPFSLINSSVAVYAQSSSWSVGDAEGFIKLFGMQGRIAAQIKIN